MLLVEELQSSTKAAAPGWSYVVDTGYDPSKVAINPTSRKRARAGQNETETSSELTLRQQTAIQRHVLELDKDSHREVNIPVPRTIFPNKKQTTNAKRILGSGKTFQYYVDEEEAMWNASGGRTNVSLNMSIDTTMVGGIVTSGSPLNTTASPNGLNNPTMTQAHTRASKTPLARRKSALYLQQQQDEVTAAAQTVTSASTGRRASTISGVITTPTTLTNGNLNKSPVALTHPITPAFVPGTILALSPPLTVSEEEIEALLTAPMLLYNSAKSTLPTENQVTRSKRERRIFCEICGYWGRIRCMKCSARICGIECKATHDESRCLKFYA